jgi:hypothetical protein
MYLMDIKGNIWCLYMITYTTKCVKYCVLLTCLRNFPRLILGCERIRKLLSQLPESSITVENMCDNGDVNFSLKRDELSYMCSELLSRFKNLISKALKDVGISGEGTFLYICIYIVCVQMSVCIYMHIYIYMYKYKQVHMGLI